LGETCDIPLQDQLFEDEWKNLQEFKKQSEVTKYFSDEFIVSCLFARKFDFKRTTELLENNLKWRKANGFMTIPSTQEIKPLLDIMTMYVQIPGARDKNGGGVLYFVMDDRLEIGKEPWTIPTLKKWSAWFYYVGIFNDGIDFLRNGLTTVQDLTGYGWKHFDIDFQKEMSSFWVDTFPIRMKNILCLNAPLIFGAVLKICKTFMKGKMLNRVEAVDKPKDLRKWITEENLLEKFGGSVQYDHAAWSKRVMDWAEKHEERLRAPGREN